MLQTTKQGDALTVYLTGEIDHCVAEGLRNEIEMLIVAHNPHRLILDFSQVSFMDSSGIGLIMGRYRALGMGQKCIMAVNAGSHIDKLLHLSGVHRYMEIQRAEEEGEDYGKSK